MHFELSIKINRASPDVFAFLRDKDLYPQEKGSPVLALDKTTNGPPGVGTGYREVVKMLPFVRGEILSEITRFEPYRYLEEKFEGAGMRGILLYEFEPRGKDNMNLIQRETLHARGILKIFSPVIYRMLKKKLNERLNGIKLILEKGWEVNLNR